MDYYLKYLKYKKKYLKLKTTKFIGGANLLKGAGLKRFRKEMSSFDILDENPTSDTYYEIEFNGNKFYVSFPLQYPLKPIKINGLIPAVQWKPLFKVIDILNMLNRSDIKNTLVYCHGRSDDHFLTKTWASIFDPGFTTSNKIYFDLEPNRYGGVKDNVFIGNGFGEEFLRLNNNLWDFIMVPDCGVRESSIEFGGLYNLTIDSKNKLRDAVPALDLLKKMLLNLNINGKLWLTKTISTELINLIIANLPNYRTEFIRNSTRDEFGVDSLFYKTIPTKDNAIGVIITRLA